MDAVQWIFVAEESEHEKFRKRFESLLSFREKSSAHIPFFKAVSGSLNILPHVGLKEEEALHLLVTEIEVGGGSMDNK